MTVQQERLKTSVSATVTVTSMQGGTVYGAYFAAPDIKPPSPSAVTAYLKRLLMAENLEAKDQDDAQQRFRTTPFFVHRTPPSSNQNRQLDEAVHETLKQAVTIGSIPRVAILSRPGGGKTMALLQLRMNAAKRSLQAYDEMLATGKTPHDSDNISQSWTNDAPIPLLIPLKDLYDGLSPLALVRTAFNRHALTEISQDQASQLLAEYHCMLLLDGLDEIAARDGIQVLRQFIEDGPTHWYIVACRTSTYRRQLGSIDALVLDDLSEDQVLHILGPKLYNVLNDSMHKLVRDRTLLKMILDRPETSHGLELPRSKGDLIQSLIRQDLGLAEGSDSKRLGIDGELIEGLLESLAYAFQIEHERFYSEQQFMRFVLSYLEEWNQHASWHQIGRVLRDIGILQRDHLRRWSFCDRTTQAYFAAAAILYNQKQLRMVLDNAARPSWRSTIEILVGLWPTPSQLILDLLDRDALVAAECLRLIDRPVDRQVRDALVEGLIERLGSGRMQQRERAVRLLGLSGHPSAREALIRLLNTDTPGRVKLAAVRALRELVHAPSIQLLDETMELLDTGTRIQRIESLIELLGLYDRYPERRDGLEAQLIALLDDPPTEQSQYLICAVALVLGCIDTERTRHALLEQFVAPGVAENLSWCITIALAQSGSPGEVEQLALDICRNPRYEEEQWRKHHAQAIYLLGWVGRQEETMRYVQGALTDDNPETRACAAQSIGRLEPPLASAWLEERLVIENREKREKNPQVLCKIAEALGRVGSLESIELLKLHLANDLQVRRVVQEAIEEIQWRYEAT